MAYSAPSVDVDKLLQLLSATTLWDTGETLSPGLSRATSLENQNDPLTLWKHTRSPKNVEVKQTTNNNLAMQHLVNLALNYLTKCCNRTISGFVFSTTALLLLTWHDDAPRGKKTKNFPSVSTSRPSRAVTRSFCCVLATRARTRKVRLKHKFPFHGRDEEKVRSSRGSMT